MGSNITLTVGAIGVFPATEQQWLFNGAALSGATNLSLMLSNVQPGNAGSYVVAITNSPNWVTSSNVLQVESVLVYGNGLLLTNPQQVLQTPVTIKLVNLFAKGSTFYTLDGSTPTLNSAEYSAPFVISNKVILMALAYSSNYLQSGILDPLIVYPAPSFTLTATAGARGSVVLNPAGGTYLSNTMVTATATPSAGWTFLQWLGDATANNSATTTVAVTRNKSVEAVFGTTLRTTATGGGSILLNPPGGVYPYGTVVTLSAVPQSGNYFGLWGDAGSGETNPLIVTVTNSDQTFAALFGPVSGGQAALTVAPLGGGQVAVSPPANAYTLGADVTATATPNPGQTFLGWSGDASGTLNPLPLVISSNRTIYANFSQRAALSDGASFEGLKPEGFALTLEGDFGARYEIDGSTNLLDWTMLGTITNSYGTIEFLDPDATGLDRRFYRAVPLP
jgi:hypothetical protein